ncbi:MAG: TetR/AcrR family transcriptional regulator [Lachnospiraceae bacterium]
MRRKDDEKQKNIKHAVIKLILEEGFHGTSISKIAKEANVSPATVYTYFSNKEEMLQDIYIEYTEEIYTCLVHTTQQDLSGKRRLESIIRNYYNYILENHDAFSFVEQFSSCPSLAGSCSEEYVLYRFYNLIDALKKEHIVKGFSDDSLIKIIFYPVKAIALDYRKNNREKEMQLIEMIQIIQSAILVHP